MSGLDYVWHWMTRLPDRKGSRCRVLAQSPDLTVLVEFEDGFRVVTSRYAIRRVNPS